jgi:hypothetical protein
MRRNQHVPTLGVPMTLQPRGKVIQPAWSVLYIIFHEQNREPNDVDVLSGLGPESAILRKAFQVASAMCS